MYRRTAVAGCSGPITPPGSPPLPAFAALGWAAALVRGPRLWLAAGGFRTPRPLPPLRAPAVARSGARAERPDRVGPRPTQTDPGRTPPETVRGVCLPVLCAVRRAEPRTVQARGSRHTPGRGAAPHRSRESPPAGSSTG